jgi:DNA gyrase inhibitor GyrI
MLLTKYFDEYIVILERRLFMDIEVIQNCRLAFMRRIGKYGSENKNIMEKLKGWAKSNQLFTRNATIYSIAQDNPETTDPEKCRYDACIIIPQDFTIDDNVEECEFIGGKYAVFKIIHTSEAIQKAYMEIFPNILKKGLKIAGKPIIERYSIGMVENNFCEICVPII